MVDGVNASSAASNAQAAISNYFSKPGVKESLSSQIEAARNLQGSDTVSFSDEAKRLFADKTKNDTEVIQGLIDKAMDMLRGKQALPEGIQKTYGLDAIDKRIGEGKERLGELTEKLRGALINGDNRAAALIGKDIAQLFKGLEPVKVEAAGTAGVGKE